MTKQEILNLDEGEHAFHARGRINGRILFDEPKTIVVMTRKGSYAKKYGKFAALGIKNESFAEFCEQDIQGDGKLINDSDNDVYELELTTKP